MDALPTEVALGRSITVRISAEPEGDVVFLPTDSRGTPGRLNGEILAKLGLPAELPNSSDLTEGFCFQRTDRGRICYVVTVGSGATNELLEINLRNALDHAEMQDARSIWLPLMGTGHGRLGHDRSFMIVVGVIRSSKWFSWPETRVTISLPPDLPPHALEALGQAIDISREPIEASEEPTRLLHDSVRNPAVEGVFALAAELGKLYLRPGHPLSSTLLFFALAESQGAAAPEALRQDGSAELFASAVHEIFGNRYSEAWIAYFGDRGRHTKPPKGQAPAKFTDNIAAILSDAARTAAARDARAITIDLLIGALLKKEGARLHGLLEKMQITPDRLLREYEDARLGVVTTKFRNDVASEEDQLGYTRYARAITDFLTHADTLPPLSISIQAPWGAGKSTLMKLIRDRLDPKRDREKQKKMSGKHELKLGSVIDFLNGSEDFSVETSGRLLTIWFNAWKYETSEQIWAGLVDAIVSQVSDRLSIVDREKFFLRLHLSRIDDGVVRKKIYERVVTMWWSKVRAWVVAGVGIAVSLFGLDAGVHHLPIEIVQMLGIWSKIPYIGGLAVPIILSVYLAKTYLVNRDQVREQPATYSLSEYIRMPNYEKAVGEIHQIHADLRRVLEIVPKGSLGDEHAPFVIFIDDLDRCSPGNVAGVVEGVSMLLASDTYRCMFVIGMDPQIVAAALDKAHEGVRKQLPSYERTAPLGWRFMDKFIQLPFTIPPTTSSQFSDYVGWLCDTDPKKQAPAPSSQVASDDIATTNAALPRPSPGASAPSTATASMPKPLSRTTAFAETRDVGTIIRNVSTYSVGNPREMKRMVNLARFYLALRAARRADDYGWRAPDLDQYARWIAVTLRWPDMMRWLQWGADEATWPDNSSQNLVVRRLDKLESISVSTKDLNEWREKIAADLAMPIESQPLWTCDLKLFEFFTTVGKLPPSRRLSAAAAQGFW